MTDNQGGEDFAFIRGESILTEGATTAAALNSVSSQSISDGGLANVDFDFVDFEDGDAAVDTSADTITIDETGIYLLSASLTFTSFTDDARVDVTFVGGTPIASFERVLHEDQGLNDEMTVNVQTVAYLGGQTIDLEVENRSVDPVTIDGDHETCRFAAVRLGLS